MLGSAGLGTTAHTSFAYAAELEGHPDNVAAAVYGGLTVVAGRVRSEGSTSIPGCEPVVLVPEDARLPTDQAREALPAVVPLADAVFNVAHGALAVAALTSGDADLLLVAMRDRLHEEARLSLVPGVREVLHRVRTAQVPACVSGAGPSLIAFDRERPSRPRSRGRLAGPARPRPFDRGGDPRGLRSRITCDDG